MPLLTSLDISGIKLTGGEIIDCWDKLKDLSKLVLRGSLVNKGPFSALICSSCITRLTYLDLSENDLSDEDVKSLADCSNIEQLTHLDLSKNKISDKGLKYLADSKHLKALAYLDVSDNNIVFSDPNFFSLDNLTALTTLNVGFQSKSSIIQQNNQRLSIGTTLLSANLEAITSLSLPGLKDLVMLI
ncbi:UNVERIFIED_CONTAM: hypothetical protein LBW93_04205 [Wolbachia endosymbiont of Nasonia longicornis]